MLVPTDTALATQLQALGLTLEEVKSNRRAVRALVAKHVAVKRKGLKLVS